MSQVHIPAEGCLRIGTFAFNRGQFSAGPRCRVEAVEAVAGGFSPCGTSSSASEVGSCPLPGLVPAELAQWMEDRQADLQEALSLDDTNRILGVRPGEAAHPGPRGFPAPDLSQSARYGLRGVRVGEASKPGTSADAPSQEVSEVDSSHTSGSIFRR